MRLRKLALAVGLASALGADLASALGLGELKLNSTLNQPLDAEIKLLNVKDLSPDEILVSLAGREDFQRAGVDRLYFLTGLKFTIDLENSSGPVVKVSTRKPVNEPYLNFLLQTQWPSGNLLREYTLLMDLPAFSDENVRPVESAKTQKASPSRSQASSTRSNSSRTPASQSEATLSRQSSNTERSNNGASVYGPVGANDTLWEIALQVRPDRSVSVQQTMLAIQRANPEAFINGNINLLRKGQVLRIPDRAEIVDLSARQAISQVAKQNTDWSGNAAGRVSGAQLDGSSRSSAVKRADTAVSGRVKLGVDTDSSESGSGAGSDGGRGEALENELAISLEELDKSRRENSELQSRVSDLESQIETMERLVEVANNDLRNLQLAQQNVEQPVDATGGVTGDGSATAVDDSAEINTAEPSVVAEDAVAEVAPEPKKAVEVKKPSPKKVVRRAPPKEPSLVDLAMENIAYIGAGLLVLIGGVWALLRRRKDEDGFDDFDDDGAFDESVETNEELSALDLDGESVGDFSEEQALDADETPEVEAEVEAQTGDVVGEADIYIAYGKLDQAEQMLQKSLASDPDQIPVLLKLMEVYAEADNIESFDQQYAHLQTLNDEAANSRAAELRAGFAGAAAFVAGAPVAESLNDDLDALLQDDGDSLAGAEAADEFDLGSLDEGLTLDLPEEQADSEVESEFAGLDFSLEDSAAQGDTVEDTADADDFDLGDLDLELNDLEVNENDPDKTQVNEAFSVEGLELPELDDEAVSPESVDELTDELDAELPSLDDDLSLSDLDLGDLDLDLDSELGSEPSDAAPLEDDLALPDLDIELNDGDDSIAELDTELAVDDLGLSDLDLDLGGDDSESPAESEANELDLELEALSEESAATEAADEPNELMDLDLSLADSDEPESGVYADALDLSLAETVSAPVVEREAEPVVDLGLDADLGSSESSGEGAEEVTDFTLSDEELSVDELESDLGDLDFAALDQEMDELDLDLDASSDLSAEPEPSAPEEELLDGDNLQPESEEDVFAEVLPDLDIDDSEVASDDFSAEGLEADLSAGDEMDDELDFLADTDEVATKLDLARAYIDMGDSEGAKDILAEVQQEGDDAQKSEAEELLGRID